MNFELIAKELKNIPLEDAIDDFIRLQKIDLEKTSSLSRVGLKFIDFYFYVERLKTVGNKGISFFTFLEDWDKYRKWPCIKRLYENLRYKYPTNFYKIAKQIYRQ